MKIQRKINERQWEKGLHADRIKLPIGLVERAGVVLDMRDAAGSAIVAGPEAGALARTPQRLGPRPAEVDVEDQRQVGEVVGLRTAWKGSVLAAKAAERQGQGRVSPGSRRRLPGRTRTACPNRAGPAHPQPDHPAASSSSAQPHVLL